MSRLPSRSPAWDRRRALENGPMTAVAEMKIGADIIVAQARSAGHGPILAEAYQMRRHLDQLTRWLASEHENAEGQANGST